MEIKTFQDLVNYIGIYGSKTLSYIKEKDDNYRKVSYDEMQQNAKRFASYLDNVKHLRKGGMVALCSENRPEWFMAYFGIVYNGVWAVPMDARLSEREIKNLILDCGAKIFVLSKDIYDTISSEPEIMNHVQEFIIFDADEKILKSNKKVVTFAQILEEGKKKELKNHKIEPSDVASLIYTSGTTGKPKGVMLTNINLISQVYSMKNVLPMTIEDTELAVLPLHHTFEFTVENVLMYNGSSICYADSLKPNKLFANIRETHVTIMLAVPLLFEKIYDGIMRNIRSMGFPVKQIIMGLFHWSAFLCRIKGSNKPGRKIFGFLRKKADLHNIKFMISGAAPLNSKVAKGLETLGLNILNGYGLTESSPVLSVNRLDRKVINESVGVPIDGVEIKIANPDKDGHGEILARGPNIMLGYYKNKAATEETVDKEGWLHTGDIGKTENHEGSEYLYITGRSKNIIVTPGGKNVYPEEIEEFLNNSDLILESLIVGVPESEHSKGENIFALIVPNYEYIDSIASIQGFKNTPEHIEELIDKHVKEVNKELKDYMKIRGFRVRTEEFPKTSTKKIKRYLFSGKDYNNM